MKILIQRESTGPNDTLGSMSIDGKFFCYTLEPGFHEEKIKGVTRIPAGTYTMGKHDSPMLKRIAPWITGVPGFSWILIHNGNTYHDTKGCILIGSRRGTMDGDRAVIDSKAMCNRLEDIFFPALERGIVTITIKDEISI